MTERFNRAFALTVLDLEGGDKVVTLQGDKGGLTKYGIASAYHPGLDVASLTEEQAKDIYFKNYWSPLRLDDDAVGDSFALLAFDAAVNHGVSKARQMMASSIRDCHAVDERSLCNEFLLKRMAEYAGKKSRFLQGWVNRLVKLQAQVPR